MLNFINPKLYENDRFYTYFCKFAEKNDIDSDEVKFRFKAFNRTFTVSNQFCQAIFYPGCRLVAILDKDNNVLMESKDIPSDNDNFITY